MKNIDKILKEEKNVNFDSIVKLSIGEMMKIRGGGDEDYNGGIIRE